jgi:hypothetical protein
MAKTVFKIVKEVLDENFLLIPGNQQDRIRSVKEALQRLGRAYSNTCNKAPDIDYNDPAIRFGYIFRYVTCHANIVYDIICNVALLKEILSKKDVTVSCIGGGPGSDFLGVMKYMIEVNTAESLRCFMLDREGAWDECWCDVDAKCECDFHFATSFQELDVVTNESWRNKKKFLAADLFTMVYFLSEINERRDQAVPFFMNLFKNSNPKAVFLFVDNNVPEFTAWVDKLLSNGGVKIITGETGDWQMPTDEEKKELGEYLEHLEVFGEKPRLKANVAFRVGVKE